MNHKYDPDSGLVFLEGQISARRMNRNMASMSQDWHRRSIATNSSSKKRKRRRTPSPGPIPIRSSLFAMCRSKLWENVGIIEEDAFEHVPTRILWDIWFHGQATQKSVPFHAWKVFIKYLSPKEARPESGKVPISLWRQVQHVKRPIAPLSTYLVPLSSQRLDFIAHLTIAEGVSCPASHLLALSTMQNLGVLEIIQPRDPQQAAIFPRVSDSILREWSAVSSQSTNTVSFPSLRVLRIWGEDFVTHKSLQYVTRFPALAVYDVAGRQVDWPPQSLSRSEWLRFSENSQKIQDEKLPADIIRMSSDPGLDRMPGGQGYRLKVAERIARLDMTASMSENSRKLLRSDSPSRFNDMCQSVAIYRSTVSDPELSVTFIPAQGVAKEVGLINKKMPNDDDDDLGAMAKHPREETSDLMGFALYSQLGMLWADRELRTRRTDRVRVEQLATVAGQLVLSSLPYAQICLGRNDYVRGFDPDRRGT
ncbi:hypothetical protein PFICI_03555 [Pestalotiopsis fici W106-1]|uniref:Uncharacterized protein n=1 Tax=Pestalotiopsis fici (strain W106-1 / CGMCC3.15140) TaxID=1229662 RepID=W3XHM7_PESFW|nr:uncharacterized protein PFICI_03555 [Pestalotiopsis fici W106-1]ETS85530.1 hypothetical protein PFICI_03555 [Pestalotiopsis fici W106-1]